MGLRWYPTADVEVELPLVADPAMHGPNSREALMRYMQDSDPAPLSLPADATIVTLRILLEEQVDASLVGLPVRPVRGARVLADLQDQLRKTFEVDVDAIEIGRRILAAAADAGGDDPEPMAHQVAQAILQVQPPADDEARQEAVGRAVLLARQAATSARLRTELPADDEAALVELEAWEHQRVRRLVDAAVVRIVDWTDPEGDDDDGRRVYDFDGGGATRWIDQLKPLRYAHTVLAELGTHAERLHTLGKARRRPSSPPSGSTGSATRPDRPGPAPAVTAQPAPPGATAGADSVAP